MKNKLLAAFTVAAVSLLAPSFARAHHGWAAFDTSAVVTFKGMVTDFHFVNPHSVVELEAKDENGNVVVWQGELTSASHLAPQGWTATSIEAGDVITITGYRTKNGAPSLWITKIVLANGKELKIDTAN